MTPTIQPNATTLAPLLLLNTPQVDPSLASSECAFLQALCDAEGVQCRTAYGNIAVDERSREVGGAAAWFPADIDCDAFQTFLMPLRHEQAEASLLAAAEIKRRHPQKLILGFSAQCPDDAASAFLARLPPFDGLLLGDLRSLGAAFVRALRDVPANLSCVPGLLLRQGKEFRRTPDAGAAAAETHVEPDYGPFLEQFAATGFSRGLPRLPVRLSGRRPEEVTAEILSLSRKYKVINFHLEEVSFETSDPAPTLRDLARLRQVEEYGFELSCNVTCWLTPGQARLLRQAGVVTAALDLPSFPGEVVSGPDFREINFRQIQTVRHLNNADVEARWRVVLPELADAAAGEELAESFRAMWHLTPPEGLLSLSANDPLTAPAADDHSGAPSREEGRGEESAAARPLLDAVREWKQAHRPRSLTYERGPGFVRIFDRRESARDWTFINLNALQAQVFLSCEEAYSFEQIAATVHQTPHDKLQRFLDGLTQRGILYRLGEGRYQSLPILRKLEERWASSNY